MVAYSNQSNSLEESLPVENISQAIAEESHILSKEIVLEASVSSLSQVSKDTIRSSLKASTLDGIFAAIFSCITGGILLNNFLLQLGATSVEIGMLSSIPMLVNLLQPLGAYVADRRTSRHWYCFWIFTPSRLMWLILVVGIGFFKYFDINQHNLVIWTLCMVFATNLLGAMGGSAWMSWMTALVPERLRGRYFGLRNSAASLSTLIGIPVIGFAVSSWPGGDLEGYGLLLFLGVIAGIISLSFQFFMVDVNPQEQSNLAKKEEQGSRVELPFINYQLPISPNFLKFLVYFGLWAFAVNLSEPFVTLYMLDNLNIDISSVTIYSSFRSGANLIMLILWGKLADRIGNRPLLILVGILLSVITFFWLVTGNDSLSVWLWLPLLHILTGGAWAAIDLCTNNLQMAVAPKQNQATYFAIAAAVAGTSGAIGTTVGGFLAQFTNYGGLPGIFLLSAFLRVATLIPLLFVHEQRSTPLIHLIKNFLPFKPQLTQIPAVEVISTSK